MDSVNVYFHLNLFCVIHLFAFTGILLIMYALLIFYYHRVWDQIPGPEDFSQFITSTPVSELFSGSSGNHTSDSNKELSSELSSKDILTAKDLPDSISKPFPASIKVSVIIPARNEELRIGSCLDALLNQTYPKALTEVIVINDFSTDETADL